MSATDELRRMLDERGVEWESKDVEGIPGFHDTRWNAYDVRWCYVEFVGNNYTKLVPSSEFHCTPEQAIAATLGNSRAERTCFADEVTHRDCKYSVNRGWRERTCKFTIEDNMNETEGMGDVWIECSACNCMFDYYADDWLMKMNYCPNCGARVVE